MNHHHDDDGDEHGGDSEKEQQRERTNSFRDLRPSPIRVSSPVCVHHGSNNDDVIEEEHVGVDGMEAYPRIVGGVGVDRNSSSSISSSCDGDSGGRGRGGGGGRDNVLFMASKSLGTQHRPMSKVMVGSYPSGSRDMASLEKGLEQRNTSPYSSSSPKPMSQTSRKPFVPDRSHPLHHRLKYYYRLNPGPANESDNQLVLRPPAYMIPPELLHGVGPPGRKQSSLSTILSIWNTMMGSSLLAMPWGFSQSGLIVSCCMVMVIGALACYTCSLILRHGKDSADFFDVCYDYLGKGGRVVCWLASVLVLVGAAMAYDRLMSDSMYLGIAGIRELISGTTHEPADTWYWSDRVAPVYILLVMFPIVNFKTLSLIVRINSFGVIAGGFMIFYTLYSAFYVKGVKTLEHVPYYNNEFPSLAGLLMLSFFIHNCILTIMKNQKNPENNNRDLVIAFVLAGLSYCLIGGCVFLAYHNVDIPQDFLNILDVHRLGAILARLSLFFQLSTVFPLVLMIIRIQVFGFLYNEQYPGIWHVLGLNVVIMGAVTLTSIFYPNVGDILRYTGAVFGTLYVFILPVTIHLRKMYLESMSTSNAELSDASKLPTVLDKDGSISLLVSTESSSVLEDSKNDGYRLLVDQELEPKANQLRAMNSLSVLSSYFSHGLIVAFGVSILALQFM